MKGTGGHVAPTVKIKKGECWWCHQEASAHCCIMREWFLKQTKQEQEEIRRRYIDGKVTE